MRVLVIKTSSMGDIVHTLPALSDAVAARPGIRFDWVVEEAYAEIPAWHPAVETVIPVALRRWRQRPRSQLHRQQWRECKAHLSKNYYDFIIDAQGLLKSAWLTRYARGPRYGMDAKSVREFIATWFYHRRLSIPKGRHAIWRLRKLFAETLEYPMPSTAVDYGIQMDDFLHTGNDGPYLVFLHATSRAEKEWPVSHWRHLCRIAGEAGYQLRLPWGTAPEHRQAESIAEAHHAAEVLPHLNLRALAGVLAGARGIVAVDTGLAHLAAALKKPAAVLYGPSAPTLIGTCGPKQRHLEAREEPRALASISAQTTWDALQQVLAKE